MRQAMREIAQLIDFELRGNAFAGLVIKWDGTVLEGFTESVLARAKRNGNALSASAAHRCMLLGFGEEVVFDFGVETGEII
jgi:hypothetical protein